ncbi:HD domain-containing protein [Pseudomonas parakoreensis]
MRAHQPINTDGSINLEAWLDHAVSVDMALDREALKEACEFAREAEQQSNAKKNLWAEGSGSFSTGLEIAEILADLKLDQDSLVAAVLYRGVREGQIELAAVSQRFGPVVAKLIDGVQRMAAISASLSPRQSMVMGTQGQVENLRKMLVAMVDDVRVALIKLAERTCAIRAVKPPTTRSVTVSPGKSSTSMRRSRTDSASAISSGNWRTCPSVTSNPINTNRSPSCSTSGGWIVSASSAM